MFLAENLVQKCPKVRVNNGLGDDKWVLGEVSVNFLCWIICSTRYVISEGNPDSNLDLKADLRIEQRNLYLKKFQS